MRKPKPHLQAAQPKNPLFKPVTVEWQSILKALSKGIGHGLVGKWEELGSDAIETIASVSLISDAGELPYLLIRRSMIKALFDLVGESASQALAQVKKDEDGLIEQMDLSLVSDEILLSSRFLDRPGELRIVHDAQQLLEFWLVGHDIDPSNAKAISARFPSYFTYALSQEWRRNAAAYSPLLQNLNTPFTRAGEREWAWTEYSALLQRRTEEGIFGEPFSLRQICC